MRKYVLGILFFLYAFTITFAQVSGRAIDSQSGSPLEGATVLTKTGLFYTTDSEGYFLIPGDIENINELTVTFIGYKQLKIILNGDVSGISAALEPENQNLRELVIKTTGFPASISRSTGSVSVITLKDLQDDNRIVLNDAVNRIPGVYMSEGGYNTSRLTIRGIGSRSPYSSNRIRAYLDDIPLTTGDGATNIEDIEISAISRIEILKGPSSAIYGSGLGGVVRMWSSQPKNNNLSAAISTELSSFGTSRVYLKTGFKSTLGSVSLVYANSFSDGYRQNSRYQRNSMLFNANRTFNKTALKFTILFTGLEAQIPSSISLTAFTSNPALAATNWLAVKGFEKYNKILIGFTAGTRFNGMVSNNMSVTSSYSDPYESRPFNILDENSKTVGLKDYIQVNSGIFEFLTGAETFLEFYNWKTYETDLGKQGSLQSNNHEKRFFLNTFALSRFKPDENTTAELGVNVNILNYALNDLFPGDSINLSGDYRYKPVISPRLAINFRISNGINLHASTGHGFSAPSLEETLLPGGQVNTNLKPETGWNFDMGSRGLIFSKLSYDITAYHISLNNLIVTQRVSEDIFTGINAGKTSHTGIESMLKIDMLSPEIRDKTEMVLTSGVTASLNHFKDFTDNNINYAGKNLPGIPSIILNHELKYKVLKCIEFTVFHKFAGKQFLNDSNSKKYNGWQVMDFRIVFSRQYGKHLDAIRFYAGVRNLFDRNYAGMVLVNATSFNNSEPRYYYPGLPRNYITGILIELK